MPLSQQLQASRSGSRESGARKNGQEIAKFEQTGLRAIPLTGPKIDNCCEGNSNKNQ